MHGSAFVIARHPGLTPDAVRQMATRLNLAEDLLEFTPAAQVAEEAGVEVQSIRKYLRARGYRRHCRVYGRTLLLPLPVVRLYLTERRVPARPRGWWGTARTAAHLGVSVQHVQRLIVRGQLDAVQHGRTYYVDPHSLPVLTPPPPLAVPVAALAAELGITPSCLHRQLRRQACPVVVPPRTVEPAPTAYTTHEAARRFLTARGHHAEQVETLLRRAVQLRLRPE